MYEHRVATVREKCLGNEKMKKVLCQGKVREFWLVRELYKE